jgi:serine/threonine-protein kinase RsbW
VLLQGRDGIGVRAALIIAQGVATLLADPATEANSSSEEPRLHARAFPARIAALPAVTAFVDEVSQLAGMARPAGLRLALLVEELFTNTVLHGLRGDCDEPVRLALGLEPDRIALTCEDTAPPHDPFTAVPLPDGTASVEDRPVGGLGVLLVATMATDVVYSRVAGHNRICLVVATRL